MVDVTASLGIEYSPYACNTCMGIHER